MYDIRYITGETGVKERVQDTVEAITDPSVPFIELTICPAYGSAYKDNVLNSHGISKSGYRTHGQYFSQNQTSMSLRELFEAITFDASELLFRMDFYTNDNDKYKFGVDFAAGNMEKDVDITPKYWPSFGRCYGIRPKDHIIKLGVNHVDIVARMDIYIYFWHPGQFMYNTKTKVFY